jgi:multiple sugar transport system substrate-binding protein
MARSSVSRLRVAALALAATVAAGMLAACGGGNDSDGGDKGASGTTELTILSSFTTGNVTGDTLKKLADKFTQQTGIKVTIEQATTNDIANNYEASKLANKERDLVVLNLTPDTSDWLPGGQVVDVKQYLDDWGITDKLQQEAIQFWTQGEDGVAGFPYWGFNWPMWYNMDLLKKAGVTEIPKTVDELIATSDKLRAAKIQPLALGGGEWNVQNFTTWMAQQFLEPAKAQELFKNGGYCNSPEAMRGLDLFGQLRDKGVFIDNVQGYTNDQMSNAFYQGKAAMMPSGSWAYTQTPPNIAANTQLGGFPAVSGGHYSKPTGFAGYSNGMFLSPNGAKKIDAVEKFIKFMYADEQIQTWSGEGAQILDVKPELASKGGGSTNFPMVAKGNELGAEKMDILVLPDNYIPAGIDYQPVATEFIGKKGMPATDFCKKLDKLYADNK